MVTVAIVASQAYRATVDTAAHQGLAVSLDTAAHLVIVATAVFLATVALVYQATAVLAVSLDIAAHQDIAEYLGILVLVGRVVGLELPATLQLHSNIKPIQQLHLDTPAMDFCCGIMPHKLVQQ